MDLKSPQDIRVEDVEPITSRLEKNIRNIQYIPKPPEFSSTLPLNTSPNRMNPYRDTEQLLMSSPPALGKGQSFNFNNIDDEGEKSINFESSVDENKREETVPVKQQHLDGTTLSFDGNEIHVRSAEQPQLDNGDSM